MIPHKLETDRITVFFPLKRGHLKIEFIERLGKATYMSAEIPDEACAHIERLTKKLDAPIKEILTYLKKIQ